MIEILVCQAKYIFTPPLTLLKSGKKLEEHKKSGKDFRDHPHRSLILFFPISHREFFIIYLEELVG